MIHRFKEPAPWSLFSFQCGKPATTLEKHNKNHIYTPYRFMLDLHIFHLLSYHISEAGIIIIFILWMRTRPQMCKWVAKHTALLSDQAINSKSQALSILHHAALPKQFKAEEAKSKYELEVLRLFSSLKNERLFKEGECMS